MIHLFIYYFCEFAPIFEPKNTKLDICLYEQTMEGYKKFFDALMKAPKNNQFKNIRCYYGSLLKIFYQVFEKFDEFYIERIDYNANKKRKDFFEIKISKFDKLYDNLTCMINENSRMLSFIENYRDKFISNPKFLIPYSQTRMENEDFIGYKTTLCSVCNYNCHKHCKDLIKNFCKCFDLKFNCKVCPNKCPASLHATSGFNFTEYEYKTLDEMFPNPPQGIEEKINFIISNLKSINEELEKKRGKFIVIYMR